MSDLDRNISDRLRESARRWPDRIAVVASNGQGPDGRVRYREWTFRDLDGESDRLAAGLRQMGVGPGVRLVLFVRFSWEFIALTFAIFKTGAVVVLIDPGMGRTNIFECLRAVQPDGFVAIPIVHAVRIWKRKLFPRARFNVTVGRRWFWGGETYAGLVRAGAREDGRLRSHDGGSENPGSGPLTPALSPTGNSVPDGMSNVGERESGGAAAIIFTSGSTGAPKGVLYEHAMFDAQVDLIRDFYGIEPGEIDLPGFPLFGLFNAAMGVTTVIPDMDPTKPAQVNPEKILNAIRDRQVTQAFGSPAFWNRVGRYCEDHGVTLPTIRRGLSAGGPVPNHVLQRMTRAFTGAGADLYTPYGATESLPVASIGGREVLERTAALTAQGKGTCVGRTFPGVDVKIVEITDGPIAALDAVRELAAGEIGEIIVRGPSVTREYFQRPEATRLAKIPVQRSDHSADARPAMLVAPPFYHRIGDVGYLDEEGLLWFCGRKAHIVATEHGRMFSVCCEEIFNEHPSVYRSALIGMTLSSGVANNQHSTHSGQFSGDAAHRSTCLQTPVIVVEPEPGTFPESEEVRERFISELLALGGANPLTARIERILFHRSLPVDTRHNVKINREALAVWAEGQT
ncbi:MAG: AMP-binding protein [Planctomycetaceae bacterium]|nr:AMP-binding protein [Planctomycetaceae bacterium]